MRYITSGYQNLRDGASLRDRDLRWRTDGGGCSVLL